MTFQINDDVFPGTAIAFIRSTWGSTSFTGSGVLVGRNDVLTASHVVYSSSLARLADRIEVTFSYDPTEANPVWYRSVFTQWYSNFDPDRDGRISAGDNQRGSLAGAELDVALLTLSTPVGDRVGWFRMDPNSAGGSVGVIGHPGVYGNRMMFDSGTARKNSVDNVFNIQSDLEINSGNSGGPIYYTSGGLNYVIGVVSTASAAAALTDHFTWLTSAITTNDSHVTTGVDVFRFFNRASGAHFFTASAAEANNVLTTLPSFTYEGIVFGTRASAESGTPVFRLYNSDNGRHFYTASREEMMQVDATREWAFENIAFNAYADGGAGRNEVYRFFQTKIGVHFYTTAASERDSIRANLPDYNYEGVAFYTDQVW